MKDFPVDSLLPNTEVASGQHYIRNNTGFSVMNNAKDKIPGGLASKKKSKFNKQQLKAGIKVEMEHTNDPSIAREIAMDHLTEDPDYYKKLKKIESRLENYFNKQALGLLDIPVGMGDSGDDSFEVSNFRGAPQNPGLKRDLGDDEEVDLFGAEDSSFDLPPTNNSDDNVSSKVKIKREKKMSNLRLSEVKKLIKLANDLDKKGLYKEADDIDSSIKKLLKIAQQEIKWKARSREGTMKSYVSRDNKIFIDTLIGDDRLIFDPVGKYIEPTYKDVRFLRVIIDAMPESMEKTYFSGQLSGGSTPSDSQLTSPPGKSPPDSTQTDATVSDPGPWKERYEYPTSDNSTTSDDASPLQPSDTRPESTTKNPPTDFNVKIKGDKRYFYKLSPDKKTYDAFDTQTGKTSTRLIKGLDLVLEAAGSAAR